jgi:hypothetical protein
LACLLAASALLGADPAVLHPLVGVVLALLAAAAADHDAGPKQSTVDVRVVFGLAADDPFRRRAHIGTVEVQPNAPGELLQVFLAQARICALGARLGAVTASLDATDQGLPFEVELARVGVQHVTGDFGDRHGDLLGRAVRIYKLHSRRRRGEPNRPEVPGA